MRSLCRLLRTTGVDCPLLLITTEARWPPSPPSGASTTSCWTPPARPRSRPGWRLATGKLAASAGRRGRPAGDQERRPVDRRGHLQPRASATASLDLTFKEFELIKYLAQHPGRVFTRAQLLQEVWGYDYFGGTRTVDVHVRRLRAKLGVEHEALIGTVRNVGYRFVTPDKRERGTSASPAETHEPEPEPTRTVVV